MSGCKQCPAYAKCTATCRGSACDRKKLIAIIKEKDYWLPGVGTLAGQTLRLADHLIANGVTVQKWNSAKTPPEDWRTADGYLTNYCVYMPEYGVDVGNYIHDTGRWICMGLPCKVTHWMPLPEPPEEV